MAINSFECEKCFDLFCEDCETSYGCSVCGAEKICEACLASPFRSQYSNDTICQECYSKGSPAEWDKWSKMSSGDRSKVGWPNELLKSRSKEIEQKKFRTKKEKLQQSKSNNFIQGLRDKLGRSE